MKRPGIQPSSSYGSEGTTPPDIFAGSVHINSFFETGMANPESGSILPFRLLDKSILEEEIKLMAARSGVGDETSSDDDEPYGYRIPKGLPPGTFARRDRKQCAEEFRRDYNYGSSTLPDGCNSSSIEKRTCVWSSGTHSCLAESSGIMWVAVYGMKSICVVTRKEKLDMTRLSGFLKSQPEIVVLQCFRKTLAYEVEELADPTSEFRQLSALNQSTDQPFGVVSVIPVNEESGQKASIGDYDEKKATRFLRKKLNTNLSTLNEVIQTAISAFQHLFHRKFKAKEIQVAVQREHRFAYDLYLSDVKEHLSVINGGLHRSSVKENLSVING